ncbi:MAG TPA: DUF3501 family protein [Methylomirabilota bacterium]|nr:DUF3501 family protein [Methylomirabilota bacterium]
MEKIRFAEVQNLYEYEKVRDARRREVIALKQRRRVAVGDRVSFLFENRQTVLFQIQEMIRAERIVADDRVQDEIDVYNELVPGPGELSATMMIEIEEKDRIKPELDRFMGIDAGDAVRLTIGRDHVIPGRFEEGHSKEDKIAAVHFVRFRLTEAARAAFAREPVALVVEHPGYRARTELGPEARAALLEDLREG